MKDHVEKHVHSSRRDTLGQGEYVCVTGHIPAATTFVLALVVK